MQQLRPCWGCLHPTYHVRCLGLSLSSALNSSFLLTDTVRGSGDGSRIWAPATHMEDLFSWLLAPAQSQPLWAI